MQQSKSSRYEVVNDGLVFLYLMVFKHIVIVVDVELFRGGKFSLKRHIVLFGC